MKYCGFRIEADSPRQYLNGGSCFRLWNSKKNKKAGYLTLGNSNGLKEVFIARRTYLESNLFSNFRVKYWSPTDKVLKN